jgi:hypothetical protein
MADLRDMARIRRNANGKLYDLKGNSSIGLLPQAPLVPTKPTVDIPTIQEKNEKDVPDDLVIGSQAIIDTEDVRPNQPSLKQPAPFTLDPSPPNFLGQGAMNPIKPVS